MVTYDSKAIIPAPFISIVRTPVLGDDGRILNPVFQITVTGKLAADKGSPNSSGVFWDQSGYPPDESIGQDSRMGSILRKQQALMNLFKTEGKPFEIAPLDGSQPITFNPRMRPIQFIEGNWFNTCDYTIQMEADAIYGLFDDLPTENNKVSHISEEWNLETIDPTLKTYRLSHALSATGKRFYLDDGTLEKEAWEQAQDWVLNTAKLGLVPSFMAADGVIDGDTLQAFNRVRSCVTNETGGTFSASETWLCYSPLDGSPPAVHDYNVNTRYSLQDGRSTVSVEGTITGLEQRNPDTDVITVTRWSNASAFWSSKIMNTLATVAETYSGITPLNHVALSTQVGSNPVAGTLTYHYDYDNRRSTTIPGALTEIVSVINNYGADVFANIPIIGRPIGPILQPMGTITAKQRSVSIEIKMPAATQTVTQSQPDTTAMILSYMPIADSVFVEGDSESWVDFEGRYLRNTTFIWD